MFPVKFLRTPCKSKSGGCFLTRGCCIRKTHFSERMFTREISSWDKTRPRMKLFLSLGKNLLLFTRFCVGEISLRDELTSELKTGMRFHPKMKKRKNDVRTLHPRMKFKMSMLSIFDVCIQIFFPKVNVFEHNENKSQKKNNEDNK